MIIEILGYSALLCSVAGSTLVFLDDNYSQYAFLLWMYSNPVFIYFIIVGYSLMRELYFVAFSVMGYTAIYGFIFKKMIIKRNKRVLGDSY